MVDVLLNFFIFDFFATKLWVAYSFSWADCLQKPGFVQIIFLELYSIGI